MAVVVRTRIGWMRFRECGKVLCGRRFSLKRKGKVYQILSQIGNIMLYGSKIWRLREREVALLRRNERDMMRTMWGMKLIDRKEHKRIVANVGYYCTY